MTRETNENTPVANRKFKDTIFRMLFSEKEALLSLYNAVNSSNYTDADALEIVTLENAIILYCIRLPESCRYENPIFFCLAHNS